MTGYQEFEGRWGERAQLAWDTIALKDTVGIPTWTIHPMDAEFIEQSTGHAPGDFHRDPDKVYLEFQNQCGVCFIDQYLASNVLAMSHDGYIADTQRTATTGAETVVCDGIAIDSPEAVVEHLERFVFPDLRKGAAGFQADSSWPAKLIEGEVQAQRMFGMDILKGPYGGFFSFPALRYYQYGYANYFMAYGLYPEVMERDFSLQADLAALVNQVTARAIIEGRLPRLLRLDHDMADSRGTLVDVRSLDRLWFPYFARSLTPLLAAGIRLIWHCDGNLMAMVPRLLECGLGGFQGFQYEDGMDYKRICAMKTRDGEDLFIIAGVSVTRTLPFGTCQDVKDQLKWLVDHGPKRGLMLGGSSSITPGTNRENIRTLIEGLNHYRVNGRGRGKERSG